MFWESASGVKFSSVIKLFLCWQLFWNSFIPSCKSLIFLLLFMLRSLIFFFPFRLVSPLALFGLFPFIGLRFCYHYNSFDLTILNTLLHIESRDSSVGIALGYGLDDRSSRVRFPAEAGNFSLHHRVQNGSGAHPVSYLMGTRGSFPGDKAAVAWSWPLTSI
jgi:hypothetical protein